MTRRCDVLPHLGRQEDKVLLRGGNGFERHHEARLALADEPNDFAEVQCMINIAQPHLKDVAAPSTRGLPGRGSEPECQQHGPDLVGEANMCSGDPQTPPHYLPPGLKKASKEGGKNKRTFSSKDRGGAPRQ